MRAAIAIAVVALVGGLGCSSSSEEEAKEGTDAAAPPEAGLTLDAGADADAAAIVVDPTLESVECASEPCVLQIVAKAGLHACARRSDGTVGCWGSGNTGQLGADPSSAVPDGGAPFGSHPVVVAGLSPAVDIAVGGNGYVNAGTGSGASGMNGNSCARTEDGSVYCWGANGAAFEGVTRTNTWTPVKMGFPAAKHLELGNGIICVLDAAGVPVCSGVSDKGDLLVPSDAPTRGPRAIETVGAPCIQLVGSARNVFCVEEGGQVRSWGFGRSLFPTELQYDIEPSLIGRASSLEKAPPAPVPALERVTSLSASWSTACAVSNGSVVCWGRADAGQLGIGARTYETEAQPIATITSDYMKQVSTGFNVTCAVTAAGRVYCWGDNARGQLARSDVQQATTPLLVDGLPRVVRVAVLEATVCALAKNGEVWCWGSNDNGQLGRGSVDGEAHPIPQPIVWGSQ